jgi:hypothetical protein
MVSTHKTHGVVIPEQQNYGLGEQHPKGATEVPLDKLSEINFDLVLLGVDAPILGSSSQLGGLVNKDYRRVCLGHEEEVQDERN